ncbi:response regulator [Limnoglobus roseus]|uniref:Response regulator n=1 Tax=Limnoglobus roseus TaxID=2598579 RepID=A0A5C1A7G4_9BACT|nr:response regulator [Limnoglobus roseus]QEL13782.1 response regulator [Limnoglobus roseus]
MNLKLNALVVDDSRVMRGMVMETLRKTGLADFHFVEAEDGHDALNKMTANSIHIAFVDWNMPNMTGIDFIRASRAHAMRNDEDPVPMVMVTSEKTMGKIQEALDDAGAEGFISKPFTADEMKRKVAKAVEKALAVQLRKLRLRRDAQIAEAETESKSKLFGRLFG